MSKYRNVRTEIDGIVFDSIKEAFRWKELTLLQRAGMISNLERQVRFTLTPTMKDENGKVIERPSFYVADFVYKENGETVVEDTKGMKTPVYILKRKLMLSLYGIRIKEL